MLEKGFVTRAEWKAHIQTHPFVAHNVWPRIRDYVPAYGYSRTEIDALFEPTVGGKKQVLYTNVINLVAGAIPYGTGATGLAGATANLFYDAANQLFGIRESSPTARVHINSVGGNIPCLNLEGGAEGELVTPDGQQLRIGHWNAGTTTFTERMKMDDAGKIFISYLTTSSVAFTGAGGEIKQDNSNFFWDDVNKRLGIALAGGAPAETLQVGGKLRLVGDDYSTIAATTGVGRQILILRGRSLIADGAGINLYGDGDSSYAGMIRMWTNNVERLEINAAGQFDFKASSLVTTGTISVTTAKLSNLTDNYIPYHVSDASGLANSALIWNSVTNALGVGIIPNYKFHLYHAVGVVQMKLVSGNNWISIGLIDGQVGGAEWALQSGYPNAGDFNIREAGVADRLTIKKTSGNVGINQTSFGANMTKGLVQATGVAPTTSPADAFQMYSADIGGVAGKAGVHFRGEDNNIVSIGSGGVLMSGTARVVNDQWTSPAGVKAPQTKPAMWVEHGISGVWQFADGDDETIVITYRVPHRMDRSVAPHFHIKWSADGESPGDCEWQLEYLWRSPGEDTTAIAQDTENITVAASVNANGLVVSNTLGLDLPSDTDNILMVRVKRLAAGGNDTIADTVELHGVNLHFTSNKIGAAI